MRTNKTPASSVIYSPTEVASLGQEYLGYRRDHKEFGVPFAAKSMSRIYPMFPGELMSIIARPGHMKTGLMMFWARQRATWMRENAPNRVSIYATWEQSVEELHSFHIASEQQISITKMAKGELTDEEWERSLTASSHRVSEPLWFIGHSMVRRSGRKAITPETLMEALEQVRERGFEVDSVFVDYLQRIQPTRTYDSPVLTYSGIMDDLKNIALGFGVPIVVGVQASREVENLKLPIPEMQHGQWTSNIEQTSDRVLSLVRPRRYRREGEMFGDKKVQGVRQLLVSCLKQKLGEANFAEWLLFNPVFNRLDEAEMINPVPDTYGGQYESS